jgi:hypothetical protein
MKKPIKHAFCLSFSHASVIFTFLSPIHMEQVQKSTSEVGTLLQINFQLKWINFSHLISLDKYSNIHE